MEKIIDIKEFDVPYHIRMAIDTEIRVGWWYDVCVKGGGAELVHRPDLVKRGEPRVCAFDIETTKLPLQFPNADYDQVLPLSPLP